MKKILALLIFCAMLALAACVSESTDFENGEIITATQARQIINENPHAIILDVRTQEEFSEAHIGSAILIPVDMLTELAPELLPNKNALILVYCRSGNRSAAATAQLIAMGYANVLDFGGIIDWPYETLVP